MNDVRVLSYSALSILLAWPLVASAQDETIRIFEGGDVAATGSIAVDAGTGQAARGAGEEAEAVGAFLATHGATPDRAGVPSATLDRPSCSLTLTSQPGMVAVEQVRIPLKQVSVREGKASVALEQDQAPQSVPAAVIGCKKGACLTSAEDGGAEKKLATVTLALRPGAGEAELKELRAKLDAARVACDRKDSGGMVVESGGKLDAQPAQPAAIAPRPAQAAPDKKDDKKDAKKRGEPTPEEVEAEVKRALQRAPTLDL